MIFPCAFSPWTPAIGDPHLAGWLTVAVYLGAAGMSLSATRSDTAPVQSRTRERSFWWLAAILMALLAVNKQLDLQSLVTAVARCMALDQGWYEDRRIVQRWFVLAIMLGGLGMTVVTAALLRGTFARTGLAVIGIGCVTVFVVIRAVSLHQVDALIDHRIAGLRLNWLLEFAGPLLVGWAAFRAGRNWPRSTPWTGKTNHFGRD